VVDEDDDLFNIKDKRRSSRPMTKTKYLFFGSGEKVSHAQRVRDSVMNHLSRVI
jgi:hypothetical protein